MSVINQMLKDLDERNVESNTLVNSTHQATKQQSPVKLATITGFVVLIVCLVTFYIWHLVSENNALKAEMLTDSASNYQTAREPSEKDNIVVEEPELTFKVKQSSIAIGDTAIDIENKPQKTILAALSAPIEKAEAPNAKVMLVNRKVENISPKSVQVEEKKEDLVASNAVTKVTPAEKNTAMHDHPHPHEPKKLVYKTKPTVSPSKAANKMSVSRRSLSPNELAAKKLALAEKALDLNQVKKAEKLLEEVVIITPNDTQTRKKLAALWFGRQAYQDSINILSQGIALDNKNSSLRQMKARILLKQNQQVAALNTLTPLASLRNEQYQVMLANTAQQANRPKIAVNAYNVLIDMQPDKGRWQLGLAVLFDKSSQFSLAAERYNTALSKNDLSVSSQQFVKQRLLAIGK